MGCPLGARLGEERLDALGPFRHEGGPHLGEDLPGDVLGGVAELLDLR